MVLPPYILLLKKGHKELVKILLAHKADPNQAITEGERKGLTPLHLAANKGHKEVIKILLAHKTDPNLALTSDGSTSLFIAAKNGYLEAVQLLLDNKANPNLARKDGATPLHWAAQEGNLEVVKLLLPAGAKVNKVSKDITPLFMATQNGHKDIVDLLLAKKGIKVNQARDLDSATALYVAVLKGHKDIVTALLGAGANPNLARKDGSTPLHWAAQKRNLEVVKLLLAHEANIMATITRDRFKNYTPLDLVNHFDKSDTAKLLGSALQTQNAKQAEEISALKAQIAKLQAKAHAKTPNQSQLKRKLSQSNLPNKKAKQKGEIPAAAAE